ncbi:MAG: ABC transporter ATP-binding protein [Gemmatimonadaceae bacterium]
MQSVPSSGRRLAWRSLEFIAPHKLAVAGIIGLALLLSIIGAADPLVLKYLFDGLGHGERTPLVVSLATLLAIEIVRAGLGARNSVLTWRVRLGVDYTLRERVLAKLTTASVDYHQAEGVGGTTNKINQSIAAFVAAFVDVAFNVLPAVTYLAISIVAMLRMEWRLAIAVLIFTPLPALIGGWAASEQTNRERRLMDRWTKLYSRLNEVLAGIRTVKLFAMEDVERRRFLDGQREGNDIVMQGVVLDSRNGAVRGLAASLARLTAIGLGGWFVITGRISLGALVAFLGYIGGLFGPVQGLTTTYQTMRKAAVALETIFEILDSEQEIPDLPGAEVAHAPVGDLRFHNISFAYPGAPWLISDFDLHVRPGETVAIVGPSGSGKTTLMNLLLRLHPLQAGAIALDGRDIRSFTSQSLRRQIAFVSQDVHLFNDTVHANIAYADPSASRETVEAAARSAYAHEFIMALPNGYDTVIGDRGGRLSGGQRQRLALARALLKDAPVLVLDEATSALDAVSESLVQQALTDLRSGRTTLVVAHRLSTVVDADRIVVLKDGLILAEGRHDELLHSCAYYASLVGAATDGLLQVA